MAIDDEGRVAAIKRGTNGLKHASGARGPAGINAKILTVAPAQLRQSLSERSKAGLIFRIVRSCGQEYADAPHPFSLFCARRATR